MFTLQILDRGQTLLYSPPAEPVTLGSGADADLQIGEVGVEARHVHLEPDGDGLRLTALGPVRINGAAVEQAALQLGDRIEIGKAVLVVGRSVARPAEPEDVLDTPRPRAGRRPEPKRSRWPYVLVAVAVVITGVLAFFNAGDERQVESDLNVIAAARDAGDIDGARRHIAACRRQWSDAEDDRLARLEAEAAKVDAIVRYADELERRVLEPDSGSYANWITELQRLEGQGEPHQRVAARMTRSSLRATLQRRKAAPAVPQPAVPEPVDPEPAVADDAPPQQTTATPASIIADADRLAAQGLFAQAISVVESELGQAADADGLGQLQRRLTSLRAEALVAMHAVIAEAEAFAAAGRHGQAVTALALVQHRFPGGGEFAKLPETLRAIEAAGAAQSAGARVAETAPPAIAVPGQPTVPAPREPADEAPKIALSALRSQLDRIRDTEAAGAYGDAATMLRDAVEMARERDPDFAARLERRAAEAELRSAFHAEVVAALQQGRKLTVALHGDRDVVLDSVQGATFVAGSERVRWDDIAAAGLTALVEQVGASDRAMVGAATLLYATGDTAHAETLLATALRADAELKPAIDRVIANGRGDRFGDRGYVLEKTGFVAVRAVELKQEVKRIAGRIDGVFRKKDQQERQRFVAELLEGGPDALDAVALAFGQDLDKQIEKLQTSSLQKQVEKLREQRDVLDRARKHAKDLIYDEVEYFYPYKPPAVSSDRFAEYNRVQAEVNRRIDAVKRLWRDDRLAVKVPASLRTSLERLDWDMRVLQDVGAANAEKLTSIEWVRALPPGRTIGIADYCLTIAERDELIEWRRIEEYNKVVGRELSSSVRELLRITNDYRTMYRHRPLAVIPTICNAAQGHAEEMSRLGYFAHMSPTPGRRTPFDRMKLAGYSFGVSENIALNGSALGAHNAWLGSSGHHRNLLNPRHKEMGIGVDGRNWVENFGGGSTYESQPAYLAAEPR